MRFKRSLLFFVAILSFSILDNVKAQNKALTLEDLTPGGKTYSKFVPATKQQLQWLGDQYVYALSNEFKIGNPENTKENTLLTLEQINNSLQKAALPALKSLPAVSVINNNIPLFVFNANGNRVVLNPFTTEIVSVVKTEKNWANQDYSAVGKKLAYTINNNLFIVDDNGTSVQVTDEKDPAVVCGQSVHRSEFGIHKGTFWSPSGKKLAFYRMDESMVTEYPLVDVDARVAKTNNIRYPMAGMKSHHVTVGIYDTESGKTTFLQTGKPADRYFTNLAWSPNEEAIYVAEINREQNHFDLNRYQVSNGVKEATLFSESDSKYVEPQTPALFFPNDASKFIWQSQKDGYNHLYLYNTDGKELKQLTKGAWIVTDVLGFDPSGNNLFYMATTRSPLDRDLFKLNLKSGKTEQLTQEAGMHNIALSANRKYFIDNYTSQYNPRTINITSTGKKKSQTLLQAENPYNGYAFPQIEVGTIKAADGVTDLYYRLVKPVDLDSTHKHPAVVYVYGGPHAQLINNSWMAATRGWDIYMASRGYVVFTVDSRGSANRGRDFENVIHRNLGVNEMADQVKGVEFLTSLPYVDADKVGVHGWSYGGFMTTNLMLSYPELFKVGAAGGPVIDWKYYEVMYGERYMDTPKENPEGYKNANLLNKAGNLKGHLLMIHGDIDPVVVWQHSLAFMKACVEARTYPDYFVYPGHEHNVIGKDRVHLHEKITRYFDDYLKK